MVLVGGVLNVSCLYACEKKEALEWVQIKSIHFSLWLGTFFLAEKTFGCTIKHGLDAMSYRIYFFNFN